jgi:hypothetical protein
LLVQLAPQKRLGERDLAQLDRWLAEAATCAEVAELFTVAGRR